MRVGARSLAAVALAASVTGCNLIFGLDEATLDPSVAGGAGGATTASTAGAGGGADWSCLGAVAPAPAPRTYLYSLTQSNPNNPLEQTPTARLCAPTDTTCADPSPLVVSSNGALTVEADVKYVGGYFELASLKYRPYVVELGPSLALPETTRGVPLYTDGEVITFHLFYAGGEEPDHGVLGVFVRDCQGVPAAGVRLESKDQDQRTKLIYLDQMGDFQDTALETDAAGAGIFANMPIGDAVEVVLRRTSDATVIGRANAHVRAKSITVLHVGPTPAP